MTQEYTDYLAHYGVKGQKHGKRRWQNEDGSLTPEGREHYGVGDPREPEKQEREKEEVDTKALTKQVKNATAAYNRAVNSKSQSENEKKLKEARMYYLGEKLERAEFQKQINKEIDDNTKISNRRLALEKKYREQGMSQKDAQVAAAKREQTEKILNATLGIAVGVAVAYGAVKGAKYWNRVRDRVVRSGKTIQNLSTQADKGVEDAFYASFKNRDKNRYVGYFGGQHLKGLNGTDVYNMKADVVKGGMKVASERTGKKVLNDLMKDKTFRLDLEDAINTEGWRKHYEKYATVLMVKPNRVVEEIPGLGKFEYTQLTRVPAQRDYLMGKLKKGKINREFYDMVNTMLVGHAPHNQAVNDRFFEALKKRGYSAIVDVNDKYQVDRYAGTTPLIVFNGKEKLTNVRNAKQTIESMKKAKKFADRWKSLRLTGQMGRDMLGGYAGGVGAGGLAIAGMYGGVRGLSSAKRNAAYRAVIRKYKEDHPKTTMTDKQILESVLG